MKAGESSADVPCCPLEKVIRCDEHYLTGYRNKVEFTIGRSFAGSTDKQGPIIVGFSHGNLSKGIMYTGSPDNICVISQESLHVAKQVEKIVTQLNEKHQIEAFDKI